MDAASEALDELLRAAGITDPMVVGPAPETPKTPEIASPAPSPAPSPPPPPTPDVAAGSRFAVGSTIPSVARVRRPGLFGTPTHQKRSKLVGVKKELGEEMTPPPSVATKQELVDEPGSEMVKLSQDENFADLFGDDADPDSVLVLSMDALQAGPFTFT